MAELNVSDLDFFSIKENLKNYLQSQSEFSDYNFDGAGLSVLLDVLSYNTHYNATLAHLTANEMFLDSAVKRSSVVSIAKSMGYTPRSKTSARASLTVTITPAASYTANSLTLDRTIPFSAAVNGKVYNFYPAETYTAQRIDDTFTFNIEVIEGTILTNSFIVDQSTVSGPFIIPNPDVDRSTISVRVQQSVSTPSIETYAYYDNILDVDKDSRVFYVDENPYGLQEIRFGDGVISKQLTVGNVVIVEYVISSGSAANYITRFAMGGTLTGSGEIKNIISETEANGGSEPEDIESIRLNAPLYNAAKNRAVTSNDYSALIKSRFDNVNSVLVWGGEENDPPIYGKVFVSIDPKPNTVITMSDRDYIVRDIIKPRSVVSIQTEFVDPIYHYLTVSAQIKFDRTVTSATSGAIETAAIAAIRRYFSENLNSLEKNFYYTDLLKYIQNVSPAIFSISVELKIHKRVAVYTNNENLIDTTFNSAIKENKFYSSRFITKIGSANIQIYLTDDIQGDATSTQGDIVARRVDTNEIILRNVGNVDYFSGKIYIPAIFIYSLPDNDYVRLYVEPAGSAPDIRTVDLTRINELSEAAIFPVAARNTVLKLDDSYGDPLNNIPTGLSVTALSSVGK